MDFTLDNKLLRNFKIIIYKLYKYYTANTTFLHIYIHPYKHTTTYHTIIFTNITYLQITQILPHILHLILTYFSINSITH